MVPVQINKAVGQVRNGRGNQSAQLVIGQTQMLDLHQRSDGIGDRAAG